MTFDHFNFGLATQEDNKLRNGYLAQAEQDAPLTRIVWNDNVPCRAMSVDGYDLLVHVPKGITQVVGTLVFHCLLTHIVFLGANDAASSRVCLDHSSQDRQDCRPK